MLTILYILKIQVTISSQGCMKLDPEIQSGLQLLREADYLGCSKFVEILTKEVKKKVTVRNSKDIEEFSNKFHLIELKIWCQAIRKGN